MFQDRLGKTNYQEVATAHFISMLQQTKALINNYIPLSQISPVPGDLI